MDILQKPLITEKITKQSELHNRYGFIVDRRANKLQIKNAVQELYKVTVTEVNTIRYGSKFKSRFTKTGIVTGKTKAYKKAIVTIAEGEKIDFYSNI